MNTFMNPALLTLLFAALGAAVVAVLILRAGTVFMVDLTGGRPAVKRGRPPRAFLDGCEDVCRLQRVSRGQIRAVHADGTVVLRFSKQVPERAHQAFRNVWTPPPSGGGGGGMRATG